MPAGDVLVEIYNLRDPISGEIRYIGKANNAQKRFLSHLRDSQRRGTPVCQWIKSLILRGLHPIVEVIAQVQIKHWERAECSFIAMAKEDGHPLLNLAPGGAMPWPSRKQRANAGRAAVLARESTPFKKRLWALKKDLAHSLAWLQRHGRLECRERIVRKLKLAALLKPSLFHEYSLL